MTGRERLRAELSTAMAEAGTGLPAADRLCQVCVELLAVDGAAISLMRAGATTGTYGSSDALSRRLDEFQFTFGEGPCLDAARLRRPVLVGECADPDDLRWPAYTEAVLNAGVQAVFAFPILAGNTVVGALELYRHRPGQLSSDALAVALWAADLAALPLLNRMADVEQSAPVVGGNGWHQPASLQRVEIYQATGMMIAQLGVDPAEALVRLRAHAFALGMTASDLAWGLVEHRISLYDNGDGRRRPGDDSSKSP